MVENSRKFLEMAQHVYVAGMVSCDPYSICFHAQQRAEKLLKAFLAFKEVEFPNSHDLASLVEQCERIDPSFLDLAEVVEVLQPFAVKIRYSADKSLAESECANAWSSCNRVYDHINQRLPGQLWESKS